MVFECAIGEYSDVYDDVDDEQHSYIRDPDPRLQDFVGFPEEEQLVSLAGRHIAANVFDLTKTKLPGTRAKLMPFEPSLVHARQKQNSTQNRFRGPRRREQSEPGHRVSAARKCSATSSQTQTCRSYTVSSCQCMTDSGSSRRNSTWRSCITNVRLSIFQHCLRTTALSAVLQQWTKILMIGLLMRQLTIRSPYAVMKHVAHAWSHTICPNLTSYYTLMALASTKTAGLTSSHAEAAVQSSLVPSPHQAEERLTLRCSRLLSYRFVSKLL
jgi:hypothetical protein